MVKPRFFIILLVLLACTKSTHLSKTKNNQPFDWNSSTVYFLLTDRFYNSDHSNDFKHPKPAAPYRGFMGGDINGITKKIQDGYFNDLGVDAIWMTPLTENITGSVDEGTGLSYGFHGYWPKDWTKIDPRLGTEEDVKIMVEAAHAKGIRVLMDAVVNHTGPVTTDDMQWPDDWVRTGPRCNYTGYISTTACTLVDNLPDVKTESETAVNLPPHIVKKWKAEGRYEKELAELDAFFKRTGYPKRPFYYIIKWLTDLIRKFGIDGFRVDTVKHTEEAVWSVLKKEAEYAFKEWKKKNKSKVMDKNKFFMVGEVYNYAINQGRLFDFGDKKVDYYNNGFDALINFGFKHDGTKDYNPLFRQYNEMLVGPLKEKTIMNYISSHDDGSPMDKNRTMNMTSATKLLLAPGIAQIYYGDESARSLTVNASGDAALRSFMNWDEQDQLDKQSILEHWRKLGQFRRKHAAIGGGQHIEIDQNTFARVKKDVDDVVVCAVNQKKGPKSIQVNGYFKNGSTVKDFYSNTLLKVINGKVTLDNPHEIVLLEK